MGRIINGASYGLKAQKRVQFWLTNHHKVKCIAQPHRGPYDLLVNGHRVEVKAARFQNKQWFFNIHRHNLVDESQVDFYILRLEAVPGFMYAIHLVIPAPLGTTSVHISLRSLLSRWAIFYNKVAPLKSLKKITA